MTMKPSHQPYVERSVLANSLASCRGAFVGVGIMSGAINVLMLTGSLFMLQVYDRVIPSRSVPTLVALALVTLALFALQGALDMIRARVFGRIGARLDEDLAERTFLATLAPPSQDGVRQDGALAV